MTAPPANQPTPPPVAATVHIYRGLMDSASTWRTRIDHPTNWAIITSGTAASFVLNDPSHSHAVLLLVMLMTITFMTIEARRTRYYHLWSSWVRLLETEYFAPILQENKVTVNDTWQSLIVRDLGFPHFKMTFWQMLGRRLRDVYLAIYLFLIISWLLKLLLHPLSVAGVCEHETVVCHATVGPIPGWAILTTVLCVYIGLIVFVLLTSSGHEPSAEVLSRGRTLQNLVSPIQQPVHQRPWQAALRGGEFFDHPIGPTDLED
jgi:uncharacterized membrane protein